MDALLKNLLAALRATDTVTERRRPDLRRTPLCDALEDRQLLSAGVGRLSAGAGMGHLRGRAAAHGPQLTVARQGLGHAAARGFRAGGPLTSVQTLIAPQGPNGAATPAPANATPATDPNAATPPPADTAADTTTSDATTTAASDSQAATTTATTAPADATTAAKPQQPPVDNTQLKTDLTKLQTDIHDILAKSQVTVAQTVALQDDFKAIDKAATTAASQDALKAFQDDVKAIGDSLPTDDQKAKLVSDFTALVNSRGVTDQTLIDKTVADAEAIVAASGVTADDLAKLAADRQTIQTDFGKPTDASSTPTSTPAMPAGPVGQPLGLGALLARGSGDAFGPGDQTGGGPGGFDGSWDFAPGVNGPGGGLTFGGPGAFANRPFGGRMMQVNAVSARGVNGFQGGGAQGGGFQGGGFDARGGGFQGRGFQGGGFDVGMNNVQYGRRGPSGPGVW